MPVLFQEKEDPQLFKTAPAVQTVADFRTALAARLGELPKEPETGFIGRARAACAPAPPHFPLSPRRSRGRGGASQKRG